MELKEQLCSAAVFKLPNLYKPFILTIDWSQKGMGAVWSEPDPEGVVSAHNSSCAYIVQFRVE